MASVQKSLIKEDMILRFSLNIATLLFIFLSLSLYATESETCLKSTPIVKPDKLPKGFWSDQKLFEVAKFLNKLGVENLFLEALAKNSLLEYEEQLRSQFGYYFVGASIRNYVGKQKKYDYWKTLLGRLGLSRSVGHLARHRVRTVLLWRIQNKLLTTEKAIVSDKSEKFLNFLEQTFQRTLTPWAFYQILHNRFGGIKQAVDSAKLLKSEENSEENYLRAFETVAEVYGEEALDSNFLLRLGVKKIDSIQVFFRKEMSTEKFVKNFVIVFGSWQNGVEATSVKGAARDLALNQQNAKVKKRVKRKGKTVAKKKVKVVISDEKLAQVVEFFVSKGVYSLQSHFLLKANFEKYESLMVNELGFFISGPQIYEYAKRQKKWGVWQDLLGKNGLPRDKLAIGRANIIKILNARFYRGRKNTKVAILGDKSPWFRELIKLTYNREYSNSAFYDSAPRRTFISMARARKAARLVRNTEVTEQLLIEIEQRLVKRYGDRAKKVEFIYELSASEFKKIVKSTSMTSRTFYKYAIIMFGSWKSFIKLSFPYNYGQKINLVSFQKILPDLSRKYGFENLSWTFITQLKGKDLVDISEKHGIYLSGSIILRFSLSYSGWYGLLERAGFKTEPILENLYFGERVLWTSEREEFVIVSLVDKFGLDKLDEPFMSSLTDIDLAFLGIKNLTGTAVLGHFRKGGRGGWIASLKSRGLDRRQAFQKVRKDKLRVLILNIKDNLEEAPSWSNVRDLPEGEIRSLTRSLLSQEYAPLQLLIHAQKVFGSWDEALVYSGLNPDEIRAKGWANYNILTPEMKRNRQEIVSNESVFRGEIGYEGGDSNERVNIETLTPELAYEKKELEYYSFLDSLTDREEQLLRVFYVVLKGLSGSGSFRQDLIYGEMKSRIANLTSNEFTEFSKLISRNEEFIEWYLLD